MIDTVKRSTLSALFFIRMGTINDNILYGGECWNIVRFGQCPLYTISIPCPVNDFPAIGIVNDVKHYVIAFTSVTRPRQCVDFRFGIILFTPFDTPPARYSIRSVA